jgi:hypothetical protein
MAITMNPVYQADEQYEQRDFTHQSDGKHRQLER